MLHGGDVVSSATRSDPARHASMADWLPGGSHRASHAGLRGVDEMGRRRSCGLNEDIAERVLDQRKDGTSSLTSQYATWNKKHVCRAERSLPRPPPIAPAGSSPRSALPYRTRSPLPLIPTPRHPPCSRPQPPLLHFLRLKPPPTTTYRATSSVRDPSM